MILEKLKPYNRLLHFHDEKLLIKSSTLWKLYKNIGNLPQSSVVSILYTLKLDVFKND